jgi:hypothetical protein
MIRRYVATKVCIDQLDLFNDGQDTLNWLRERAKQTNNDVYTKLADYLEERLKLYQKKGLNNA